MHDSPVMKGASGSEHSAPLVSVLICSFNAEKFIESTLRSVMNQTYENLEILVRDNASRDGTVGMLESLGGEDARIEVYGGRENLGAYGGLNYLLDRARGKYVAIQDHDDIWHSDKIRRQVAFLEENGDYIGCGSAMVNYYAKYDTFLVRHQRKAATVAWHTSVVFRNTGKRYDASIGVATDFHFMKHILCENQRRICNLEEPLVLRRIRGNEVNLSGRWVNLGNLKDIFTVKISMKDRIPILCRLLLSHALFDQFVLKVLLRRNVLSESTMKKDPILNEYRGKKILF